MKLKRCLVFLLLLFLHGCVFGDLILKIDEGELELHTFVKTLFEKHNTHQTMVVIYQNKWLDILIKYVKVKAIFNNNVGVNFIPFSKFNTYLLLLKSFDDLQTFYQLLKVSKTGSYRANYLIFYFNGSEDDMENIFELSWNNKLLNVNIVVQRNKRFEIYTYFPFMNGSCGNEWKPIRIETKAEVLFPEKVPTDLQGCPIKLGASKLEPYIINITADGNDAAKAGVEVVIIHNVVKRMNMTGIIVDTNFPHWGYLYPDGHFTYAYKAVYTAEIDITFGMAVGNDSLNGYFDFTVFTLDVKAHWVVPAAPQAPQWKNLSAIFEALVWFIILLSFIVNGVFWWLVGRKKEKLEDYNDLTLCLMGSFYMLLQGSFTTPKTWILRFSLVVWSIGAVLLFTAHQCELTGILTSPLYEHQISNLEELVNSDIQYGFYPLLRDFFDPNIPLQKKVLDRAGSCDVSSSCINRTAFKKDFATLRNKRSLLYYASKYYVYPNGKLMLYFFKNPEGATYAVSVVRKGFPYLNRINSLLLRLHSSGLIAKWEKDVVADPRAISLDEMEPLSMNHLQAAFYIWIVGLFISGCVFLREIYKRVQQQRKQNTIIRKFNR